MDVKRHLQQAIETKEQTTIIYNGGSAPGTTRRIAPIEIKGDSLIARCLESNARKTFKLAKIELSNNQAILPYQVEDRSAWTFAEHTAAIRPIIKAAGWHSEETACSLLLFRFFKNGKLRKTPEMGIRFQEFTTESEWDMQENRPIQTEKPAVNPWKVFAPNQESTRSFRHLDKAFSAFAEALSVATNE
jgi:hypothetical protein